MRKIFTDHCVHRPAQRRIDIKYVHEAIDNPDTTEDVSTPTVKKLRFTKRVSCDLEIEVICELRSGEYRVITVWNKEEDNDTNKL